MLQSMPVPPISLDEYREYLLLLGRLQLAPAIAAKVDLDCRQHAGESSPGMTVFSETNRRGNASLSA